MAWTIKPQPYIEVRRRQPPSPFDKLRAMTGQGRQNPEIQLKAFRYQLSAANGLALVAESSSRLSSSRNRGSVRLEAGAIREVKVLLREMPAPGSQR